MPIKKSKTKYGIVSYFDTEEFIGKGALDRGVLWEETVTALATLPYFEKSNYVLDIGAHVGLFTLQAKKFNDKCAVQCFEIQEKIYELLNENITQNKLTNVKTFNCAIGDSIRKITVSDMIRDGVNANEKYEYDNGKRYNFGGVSIGPGTKEIDMVTIDSLNLKECDFIKLDIENFEFFAICGGMKTLKKFKPVLFFEHLSATSAVTPDKFMLDICSDDSMKKYKLYKGNIFSLLESIGYNYFQRWATNYCARCDKGFETSYVSHHDAYEIFSRMTKSGKGQKGLQEAMHFLQSVHERKVKWKENTAG